MEESDSNTSIPEPYKNAAPMVYPKPVVEGIKEPKLPPPIRKSTSRSHNSDHEVTVLQTIPETSTASPILDVEPATPTKSKRVHSLGEDSLVPVTTRSKPWPLLQYLGQKWYMMPPKKENDPNVESAPASQEAIELSDQTLKEEPKREPAEEVVIKSPRHSVDQDGHYATEAVSKHAAHTLDEDAMVPVESSRVRFKHLLDQDVATPSSAPSTQHHLDADQMHDLPIKTASKHDLTEDETTAKSMPATPHELGDKTTN